MNQPWQQPPQQPFPGQQPQQPPTQQPMPQAWPQQAMPQQPQPQQWVPPQQQQMQPMLTAAVAAAAQTNTFAQMLAAPARPRRNRERPPDGTHVVQFSRETKMEVSQTTFQPYLLLAYTVVESTVPEAVNKTFQTPMMMAQRASVEALAEMAKVIFGAQAVSQMAAQNIAPADLAKLLCSHVVNQQTGQGLFALLNTWRSTKGKNGAPPPSYDEAFVNHDWMMANPAQFSLAQAKAAGHQIRMPQMRPVPTVPGQWNGAAVAPAQQAWAAPQAAPAPQQAWAPAPQQQFAPVPQAAPQQGFPPFNVQPQQPQAFPPPANVQAPPVSQPPQAFFPLPAQQQPGTQGFPPVQR